MPPKTPFDPTAYAAKRKEQIERAKELRKARSSLLGGAYDTNDHRMIHETLDPYKVPTRKSRSRGASPPRSAAAEEALSRRRARSRGASPPSRDPTVLWKSASSSGAARRRAAAKNRAPTIGEDDVSNIPVEEKDFISTNQNASSQDDLASHGAPFEPETPIRRRTIGGSLSSGGATGGTPGGGGGGTGGANIEILSTGLPRSLRRSREGRDGSSASKAAALASASRKDGEGSGGNLGSNGLEKTSLIAKLRKLFKRASDPPPVPSALKQSQDQVKQGQDQVKKSHTQVQTLVSSRRERHAHQEGGSHTPAKPSGLPETPPQIKKESTSDVATPGTAGTTGGTEGISRVASRLSRKGGASTNKEVTPGPETESVTESAVPKTKLSRKGNSPLVSHSKSPSAGKVEPQTPGSEALRKSSVAFGSNVKRGVPWDHVEEKETSKKLLDGHLSRTESENVKDHEVQKGGRLGERLFGKGKKHVEGEGSPGEKGKKNESRLVASHEDLKHVACPHCDRKFREDSLDKHERICRKVFLQKRKPFNSTAKRVQGTDAAEFVKIPRKSGGRMKIGERRSASDGGSPAGKEAVKVEVKKTEKDSKEAKLPKWKAQSLELQEAIRAAREMRAKRTQ